MSEDSCRRAAEFANGRSCPRRLEIRAAVSDSELLLRRLVWALALERPRLVAPLSRRTAAPDAAGAKGGGK